MLPHDLFVVRHGKSEGNEIIRRFKHPGSTPVSPDMLDRHHSHYRLTSKGQKQAKKVGEWLKKWLKEKNLPHFDEHFVSTHVRATETAGLLDLPDANWKLDFELRERSNGIWGVVPDEGWKEPEKNHRFYTSMPGGESIADVCGRLLRRFIPVLDRKILNNEQRAVIVAHGDLMQALRVVFEGISPDEYDRRSKESACDFRIGNGQIFHYTRIPPGKEFGFGNAFKGFGWVRSINPWDEKYAGHDWRPIPRNSKSNSDLLEMADLFPRLVDDEE